MSIEIERRFYTTEVRLEEVEGVRRIVGYAALFNQMSEDLGGWWEMIEPGAFTSSLERGDDVRALFNHDANMILGRTRNGTLVLNQDDHGLRYAITPPDTSYARDLMVSLERGDVDQSSFGFRVSDDRWETVNERNIRTVIDFKRLFDISPVTFPAFPQTSAEARAMAEKLATDRGASAVAAGRGGAVGRLTLRRRRLDLLERE